jgi:hypothetical protein
MAEKRRLPVAGRPRVDDPPAEELHDTECRRATLEATSVKTSSAKSSVRRTISAAAGASSAYSTYFPAVTMCSFLGYADERG